MTKGIKKSKILKGLEKRLKTIGERQKKISGVVPLRHWNGEALKKEVPKKVILKELNKLKKSYKKICKKLENS